MSTPAERGMRAARIEAAARKAAEAAREHARERTEGLPQYEGKFEDWVPVQVKRSVRTKMGLAFKRGEFSIAAPDGSFAASDPWTGRQRLVWSVRNGIQTAVDAEHVEEL